MSNDQSPFAVGDRVRVRDASASNGSLEVGQIHEVSGLLVGGGLRLRGVPSHWRRNRFTKVEAPAMVVPVPFAVGDRVRVVDASGANGALKVGQIHEVSGVTYPATLHLHGVPSYWSARRFEKVEAPVKAADPAPFAVGDRVRVRPAGAGAPLRAGDEGCVLALRRTFPGCWYLDFGGGASYAAWRFERAPEPGQVGGDAIDQLVADLEAALQTWRRAKIARAVRA